MRLTNVLRRWKFPVIAFIHQKPHVEDSKRIWDLNNYLVVLSDQCARLSQPLFFLFYFGGYAIIRTAQACFELLNQSIWLFILPSLFSKEKAQKSINPFVDIINCDIQLQPLLHDTKGQILQKNICLQNNFTKNIKQKRFFFFILFLIQSKRYLSSGYTSNRTYINVDM